MIKLGNTGEVHYFEHVSGQVAGVKFFPSQPNPWRPAMDLQSLLSATNGHSTALFALLKLGLTESLANGMISPDGAIRLFYNAENCLHVRKCLRQKIAAEVMSRGTQLPDLFEALPADEALRKFHHELATIRSLCLRLLEKKQVVA